MGSPEAYLPPALSDETIFDLVSSLHLPRPTRIEPLQVTAAFHSIYLLTFAPSATGTLYPARKRNEDGYTDLVLRVSGDHVQAYKTRNEVAVMAWVAENTSVPVPAVVRYDATPNNPLGREFTLLECAPGRSVNKMYDDLDDATKRKLVSQLTDFVTELNKHDWNHVGGLKVADEGSIVPGPVLEDTFWMGPDIPKYWGDGETFESLNPTGPFTSHAGLVQGYLERFIHAVEVHSTLSWLRNLIPSLRGLIAKLPAMEPLSSTRLILAHKDLHFCNVMATPDGEITGVLDWEFAGVVPALRWDPVRAFLWNGQQTEAALEEKNRLRSMFESGLKERGIERWWSGNGQNEVDEVWTVIAFMRALVEVCPRGQRADKVEAWRSTTEGALERLGV